MCETRRRKRRREKEEEELEGEMSSAEKWLRRDKLLGANSGGKTVGGSERERATAAAMNALMESGEGMWSGGEPAHALSELTGRRTNMTMSGSGKKNGMNNFLTEWQ